MVEILDEAGEPILDEDGQYILDEDPYVPKGSITPTGACSNQKELNRSQDGDI